MPSLTLVHLNAQGVHVKSAVQKWYRIETIGDDWVPNGGMTRSSKNEKTSQNTWFYEAFKAPPVGLEPTTNGLTVRCSTN